MNRRDVLRILAGMTAVPRAAGAAAAQVWAAGVATVDITPERSLWMAGFARRSLPSQGVALPLHAKALALRHGRGRPVVLVTADLLGVTARITDRVASAVRRLHGVERADILFNASHTHCGPVVDEQLSVAYDLTPAAVGRHPRLHGAVGRHARHACRPGAGEAETGTPRIRAGTGRVRGKPPRGSSRRTVPSIMMCPCCGWMAPAVSPWRSSSGTRVTTRRCRTRSCSTTAITPASRRPSWRPGTRARPRCSWRAAEPTRTRSRGARSSWCRRTVRHSPTPSSACCPRRRP